MTDTPDPDDTPSREPIPPVEACEVPSHWGRIVELERERIRLQGLVATLSAQVEAMHTGVCRDSRHHDLEADLMRANGEVSILSGQVARLQRGDGGAF